MRDTGSTAPEAVDRLLERLAERLRQGALHGAARLPEGPTRWAGPAQAAE
ncbi:MAG TPA: hypothetical protein VKZ81_10935 [Pseudonocardia sp.]|nr:hypothetical protein [Pseudonocardia sp.]HLU55965.1 hypothetical protein [Pseudonocardia sp.]